MLKRRENMVSLEEEHQLLPVEPLDRSAGKVGSSAWRARRTS